LTDYKCDKCGKPMVIKTGRYGEFLSCTGYPTCKNAKPVPLGIPCPKCGGELIEIKSRRRGGRSFYGCSNYSAAIKCDYKLWQKPIKEPCPSCAAPFLVLGGGKKNPSLVCLTEGCGFKKPLEEASSGSKPPGPDGGGMSPSANAPRSSESASPMVP
jgi:DNA topoisomerase-1